jgi:hypothetical protein
MNPLAPPITPVLKRPLQTTIKMKTLLTAIAVLCILASTSIAIPVSDSIPLPQNTVGASTCRPQPVVHYTISYDSSFGGHWDLTGKRTVNHDGTYTDSFRGTVSDTSMQASITRNDLDWVSDWYWLCAHTYAQCSSFSITISDGNVNGFATYRPQ